MNCYLRHCNSPIAEAAPGIPMNGRSLVEETSFYGYPQIPSCLLSVVICFVHEILSRRPYLASVIAVEAGSDPLRGLVEWFPLKLVAKHDMIIEYDQQTVFPPM